MKECQDIFGLTTDEALSMAGATMGYPFAFQVLGYLCWIKKEKWQNLLPLYDTYPEDYVYEKIWSELSQKDQAVLTAMSSTSSGKVEDIRSLVGMPSNNFTTYRSRLIRKGLIISPSYIVDIQNLTSGSLSISGTHYVNTCILPLILPGFHAKYPGIDIRILEHGSSVLINMLEKHQLDLYFSCDPDLIRSFPGTHIFDDRIILAVPAEYEINRELAAYSLSSEDICRQVHLRPGYPSVSLSLFEDVPFILQYEGSNFYERASGMFREANVAPKVHMQFSQSVTVYRFAMAGMGAAFAVDRLVQEDDHALRYYKIDSRYAKRENYLLQPRKKYTTAAMNAFHASFILKKHRHVRADSFGV